MDSRKQKKCHHFLDRLPGNITNGSRLRRRLEEGEG
jgi:hypothetical protein